MIVGPGYKVIVKMVNLKMHEQAKYFMIYRLFKTLNFNTFIEPLAYSMCSKFIESDDK